MKDELSYLVKRAAQGKLSRRAFLGRASALGLTSAMATSLLTKAVLAEGPKKGGHLRLGIGGGESVDSLDPSRAMSSVPINYLAQCGNRLINVNPDGSLAMRLATEIDSSPDARTWYFRVRQGVEFHNGKTLTPEDVLLTIQRHTDEKTASGSLGVLRAITDMRVDGDMFVVELNAPNADLPYIMNAYHLVIQPTGGLDDPTAGIFTGPYRMVENEPGVSHGMEKFANHWDDSVGHFNSTEIIVINDATARSAALQSGQVQIINKVEPRVAHLVGGAPNIDVQTSAGPGFYSFLMHCNTAPFDDNDLRLALKYAIDREEILSKVLRGFGSIGNDTPINSAYPLFDELIPQREFDLDRARHHYAQSGHDGSPIVLRVSEVAFSGAVDAALLFQETAAQAGISIEVRREPGDGYWSAIWNRQPFTASEWGGRPTQDQIFSTAYLSTAEWNDTRFFNDHFDKLLLQARGELDQKRRKEIYGEMSRMVRDEGGLICPVFNEFIDAHSTDITGWESNSDGELMAYFAAVKMWQA